MAIQMRRGLLSAYDKDKMLAGEWGIAIDADTDNQKAYVAFAPGVDKEVLFVEDAAQQLAPSVALATAEAEAWTHGDSFTKHDYASGDGSTTAFTLVETPASITNVYVDGAEVTEYTLSGKVLTFTTAPSSGSNNIHVIYTVNTTTDNAKYYKEQAANSEAIVVAKTELAEEAAGRIGYIHMDITDGHLYYTGTDNLDTFDFELTDGHLYVTFD